MPKTSKSNQRSKNYSTRAKIGPVSKTVYNEMVRKIKTLNAPPYSYTYEQISKAMGRTGGYAHLIIDGSRVAPTEIEQQGLEGMYLTALQNNRYTRNDTDKRITIIGLAAQLMRAVNEL